jgi:hypothetical protein
MAFHTGLLPGGGLHARFFCLTALCLRLLLLYAARARLYILCSVHVCVQEQLRFLGADTVVYIVRTMQLLALCKRGGSAACWLLTPVPHCSGAVGLYSRGTLLECLLRGDMTRRTTTRGCALLHCFLASLRIHLRWRFVAHNAKLYRSRVPGTLYFSRRAARMLLARLSAAFHSRALLRSVWLYSRFSSWLWVRVLSWYILPLPMRGLLWASPISNMTRPPRPIHSSGMATSAGNFSRVLQHSGFLG